MEPKKENKYLVVKLADIEAYFNRDYSFRGPRGAAAAELALRDERELFNRILATIKVMRKFAGKKDNKYVVINEDEPYAEKVWALILAEERKKQDAGL